jgi:putative transposase
VDRIPVAVACRVLETSRSGYYDWAARPESARETENRQLAKMIKEIHRESRFSYGSPQVTAELRLGYGLQVNRKRVPGSCGPRASRASTGAGAARTW